MSESNGFSNKLAYAILALIVAASTIWFANNTAQDARTASGKALSAAKQARHRTENLNERMDRLQTRVANFVTQITDAEQVRCELLRAIYRAGHHHQSRFRCTPPQPR